MIIEVGSKSLAWVVVLKASIDQGFLKGKLLENEILVKQAANNSKEQFGNSPDLATELMNAIMAALDAHTAMSTQALDSEAVRNGLKDVLLGPARLYESLREQVVGPSRGI